MAPFDHQQAVAELSERGVRLDDLSKFVSVVVLCSFTDQERMRKLHGDDSRALSILCKPYRAPTLRYRLLIVAGATVRLCTRGVAWHFRFRPLSREYWVSAQRSRGKDSEVRA